MNYCKHCEGSVEVGTLKKLAALKNSSYVLIILELLTERHDCTTFYIAKKLHERYLISNKPLVAQQVYQKA